jgi:aryl-phospho-beta-D-glucosidase BglC (GH1 family)
LISHYNEIDINNKLNKRLKITGLINNVFRPKETLKKTRIKLYNTLAFPTLSYGSEKWTIKARDATRITAAGMKYVRITAAGMKYVRITAGYTWTDHKTNKVISKELNINPALDKIQGFKGKWIQHVNRMPRKRLPRLIK